MTLGSRLSGALLSIVALIVPVMAQEPTVLMPDLPRPAKAINFQLLDHAGRAVELHRQGVGAKAIVLYVQGNGCPIVRQSIPQLKELRDAYVPQGVKFFMLNANPQDDRAAIAEEADEFGIDIPILVDESQQVAKALGCVRTAEAIVINPAGWDIVYRGAMDDRTDYVGAKSDAQHPWLKSALDALLAGAAAEPKETPTKGCLITYQSAPERISYQTDIVPILKGHCVSCHSPGKHWAVCVQLAQQGGGLVGDDSGSSPFQTDAAVARGSALGPVCQRPWHDPARNQNPAGVAGSRGAEAWRRRPASRAYERAG